MKFNPNKTPVELIKGGAIGGTYFRDIYYSVNGNWYKSHGKNSIGWKILIRSFIVQIIMMSMSINMVLNAENS